MFIPPEPPVQPEYHHRHSTAESLHQREHARKFKGGIISDIAVSVGELFKLTFRLVTLPVRLPARWWVSHKAKNATR